MMQKKLDLAIMRFETAKDPTLHAGYCINGKSYENYLSEECWKALKAKMETEHPAAFESYGKGGGKELEERKVGQNIYPPKMASFGSSSRMIYHLMKDIPQFSYEEQLPTSIGGKASLDGFLETEEKCVFVEAKCREIYAPSAGKISNKYGKLYEYLTNSRNNPLLCSMTSVDERNIWVQFFSTGKQIRYFDIKQMICHLLGIATARLQGRYDKKMEFVYLIYNPADLQFDTPVDHEAIMRIYNAEREECASIDFKRLFCDVLCFLAECKKQTVDAQKIADEFSFRICDQNTILMSIA